MRKPTKIRVFQVGRAEFDPRSRRFPAIGKPRAQTDGYAP